VQLKTYNDENCMQFLGSDNAFTITHKHTSALHAHTLSDMIQTKITATLNAAKNQ